MPWNISASVRGSSVLRSAARPAVNIGGSTSGHSASRRFHTDSSRLVSASPLQGRGVGVGLAQGYGHGRRSHSHSHGYSDLGLPGGDDDDDVLLGTDLPAYSEMDLSGIESEQRPVPVAHMGSGGGGGGSLVTAGGDDATMTARRPQPLQLPQAHLDRDAFNFLAFLEDAIASREGAGEGAEETEEGGGEGEREPATDVFGAREATAPEAKTTTLEALLPPAENSAMVAAQGLLHTLTLASRNVLKVWQREPFGEIRLRVLNTTA